MQICVSTHHCKFSNKFVLRNVASRLLNNRINFIIEETSVSNTNSDHAILIILIMWFKPMTAALYENLLDNAQSSVARTFSNINKT